MDTNPTPKRRAFAVLLAIVVSVATLVGGMALAGASEDGYDSSSTAPTPATAPTTAPTPADTVAVPETTEPFAAVTPIEVTETTAPEPPAEAAVDCEAFFADFDARNIAQSNAQNERLAAVFDSFGIANELLTEDGYTYVHVDYEDPIIEAISNSFWAQVHESADADEYDHPCFFEMDGEGCEGDFEMTDEEAAQIRADIAAENEALEAAFTEAGIAFWWETDEFLEVDMIVWDWADSGADEVFYEVFYELHPELAIDMNDEAQAEQEMDFQQMLDERNATLTALANAFAEAGVEHDLDEDYDWFMVTFDLDDERAVPVIAEFL